MPTSPAHFEAIYHSHFNAMCNLANRIVKDRDAAKDIVQELFVKLWRSPDDLSLVLNPKAYLFKATANAAINYLARARRTVSMEQVSSAPAVKPDETISLKALERKISEVLDRLPPKCRAIFMLSRFEDMKYREIADHLNISVKTVEHQMGIALSKMREDLKPFLSRESLVLLATAGLTLCISWLAHK